MVTPFSGDLYGPRGIPEAERSLIVEWVGSHSRIFPAGKKALDALLAECGRDLFPARNGPLEKAQVGNDLRIKHDLKPVVPRRPVYDMGTLEVSAPGGVVAIRQHTASFTPATGGSAAKVRIDGPMYVDNLGQEWWSYQAIAAVARKTLDDNKAISRTATPVELGAFAADRRSAPVNPQDQYGPGLFGGVLYDGTLVVATSWAHQVLIDPAGRVRHTTGNVEDPGPPLPPVWKRPQLPIGPPPPTLSRAQVSMLVIESMLSAAMAVALMFAGRRLVQRSEVAPAWARVYAVGQVTLSLLGAVLGGLVGAAVYTKLGQPPPGRGLLAVHNMIGLMLSCLWPGVLLWATHGRLARGFLLAPATIAAAK